MNQRYRMRSASAAGHETLRQSGRSLVERGVTDESELARVLGEEVSALKETSSVSVISEEDRRVTLTDLELLDRFRSRGDAEAFSEIVRRYASTVYAAGRRILGDSGSAEDVAQETFFRLMRRPELVTQSLGGWLHRSATAPGR